MHMERYESKDRLALPRLALTTAFALTLGLTTPVFAKSSSTPQQRSKATSSAQQQSAQQGAETDENAQQQPNAGATALQQQLDAGANTQQQPNANAQQQSNAGANAQQSAEDSASTQKKTNKKSTTSTTKKRTNKKKGTDPYTQMWKDAGNALYGTFFPIEPLEGIINGLSDAPANRVLEAGRKTYRAGLMVYAQGRQIPLEYVIRDTQIFGPWDAYKDHFAEDADPNGLMTEWQKNYYITHDWSEYGKQILTIIPGDQVVINGRTMQVYNMFDYPKVSFSDEIWELVGYDSVVIQTCDTSDENLNRIVYGYWLNGQDDEAEEEAQSQAQPQAQSQTQTQSQTQPQAQSQGQRRSETEGGLIEQQQPTSEADIIGQTAI